jgi:MoxR-like ATPase
MTLKAHQIEYTNEAYRRFGATIDNRQAGEINAHFGIKSASWLNKFKIGRGIYELPIEEAGIVADDQAPVFVVPNSPAPLANTDSQSVENVVSMEDAAAVKRPALTVVNSLVPKRDPLYIPFGFAANMEKIIKSRQFYPVFVTGLSGNGKTFMIEQTAAKLGRKLIRANITVETDEDDLIGGFRLVDGQTMFFKGPAIKAMEEGAILLLDEIDLGHPSKIMCLQSILEGSSYFIKKTGETVEPKSGFTIIATANTKGKGSLDGSFIGTNVLNEAFLERFNITVEQEYPTPSVEKRILSKVFADLDLDPMSTFIDKLTLWAEVVRRTYYADGIDEIIATRRLIHIARTYAIFKNRQEAVKLCLNRFDEATQEGFMRLYNAVDDEAVTEDEDGGMTPILTKTEDDYEPF